MCDIKAIKVMRRVFVFGVFFFKLKLLTKKSHISVGLFCLIVFIVLFTFDSDIKIINFINSIRRNYEIRKPL